MRACPGRVGNVDRVGMMGRLLSGWGWAGMEERRAGWEIWAECLWVGMMLACRHGGQGAYRAGMVSMERGREGMVGNGDRADMMHCLQVGGVGREGGMGGKCGQGRRVGNVGRVRMMGRVSVGGQCVQGGQDRYAAFRLV